MSYIKATEVRKGDVLRVPGHFLHEDTVGLVCEIRAEVVAHQRRTRWSGNIADPPTTDEIVVVTHSEGRTTTWFYADEPVVRVTRGPS